MRFGMFENRLGARQLVKVYPPHAVDIKARALLPTALLPIIGPRLERGGTHNVKHSSSVIRQAVRAAWLIPVLLALAGCATMPRSGANLLSRDDMAFLEHLAADVVAESRVPQGAKVGAIGPNVTGYTVIRPGGRNAYPAFWIRDYAMSLGAGLITADEQRHALLLTARHQQDVDWPLPSGSFVPAGAIPDHISFGDKPIFYPGTLEDY
jgi:hypothetical protein